MNSALLAKVAKDFMKKRPKLKPGDKVRVTFTYTDKRKVMLKKKKAKKGAEEEKTGVFEGLVISVRGAGPNKTFTVRKISYGIGVERIFPYYSTAIKEIKILSRGKVRRAKLYYMRNRIGKKAMKIKNEQKVNA